MREHTRGDLGRAIVAGQANWADDAVIKFDRCP